jgi:NADH dehydrogenase
VQALAAKAGRVLITGANGHLGRRLIQKLAAGPGEARPVRAVVRSESAARTLRELRDVPAVEIAVLDYGDIDALSRTAAGCEAAVHLVGIIKEGSRSRYEEAHEATSHALSRAAAGAGMRRIVYLSISGSDPDSPNACLASKGRAERILLDGATPALILRVPMVLGPDDIASRALRAQARSRLVPLLRGGAGREQPIDADDVVSAILSGIERPDLDDVAFDLAGPESLSRRALLERTAALYGNRPAVIPIPLYLELTAAFLLETILSDPPLTRAMVGVLHHDDVVDTEETCERLGIRLTPLDRTLRRCVGPQEAAP